MNIAAIDPCCDGGSIIECVDLSPALHLGQKPDCLAAPGKVRGISIKNVIIGKGHRVCIRCRLIMTIDGAPNNVLGGINEQ